MIFKLFRKLCVYIATVYSLCKEETDHKNSYDTRVYTMLRRKKKYNIK